jgi:hypothetical protein
MNSEIKRLQHETQTAKEGIKENKEKIKLNKQVLAGYGLTHARPSRSAVRRCGSSPTWSAMWWRC